MWERVRRRLLPDLEDLPGLLLGVGGGGDDEQAVQQVDGDAVRTMVVCAADAERNGRSSRLHV